MLDKWKSLNKPMIFASFLQSWSAIVHLYYTHWSILESEEWPLKLHRRQKYRLQV